MAKQKSLSRDIVSAMLWFLIIHSIFLCLHSSESSNNLSNCIESEREALLTFKAGLIDPTNILSSWEGEECCTWWGVSCSNKTSHIVELNLRRTMDENFANHSCLSGVINPSLLHLKHLCRLDLSFNNFSGTSIPEFIGSFENLRYLNLSAANFVGLIPPQLGNLALLRYLDLNAIHFEYYLHEIYEYVDFLKLYVDNLRWLPHLSSLKFLDMSFVKLTRAKNWLKMVNMLPSLTTLNLANCQLDTFSSSLSYLNFTSLNTLDLSYNNFNSTLPQWLGNLTSLTHLDLAMLDVDVDHVKWLPHLSCLNYLDMSFVNLTKVVDWFQMVTMHHSLTTLVLEGCGLQFIPNISLSYVNFTSLNTLHLSDNNFNSSLPQWLWNLTSLTHLNLGGNSFHGPIPDAVGNLVSLEILQLDFNNLGNQLDGPIPVEIGKLSHLYYIDLFSNSFTGVVSEAHFANLTNLKTLVLSMNSLTFFVDDSWVPTFQLHYIELDSCQLGPYFPSWHHNQMEVSLLDLSNCSISGTVPNWFWEKLSHSIHMLDLSNNQISGKLPKSLEIANQSWIFLNSNHFEGLLPPGLLSSAKILDLSNNSFSGPIPNTQVPYLRALLLSNNQFNSSIPSSLCKVGFPGLGSSSFLDLSNNNFSGEIPNEWQMQSSPFIILANNHFSGRVPNSIGLIINLQALILRNNSLSGWFLQFLQACNNLTFLDLSQNNFFGNIPTWLGENLTSLTILNLRSNFFSENIPPQFEQFPNPIVLDLANNNLSGPIPRLGNFSAMTSSSMQTVSYPSGGFDYNLYTYYMSFLEFTKGVELEYTKNQYLMTSIDLSNNYSMGEIPEDIGALIGLMNLDLSRNCLKGNIPKTIGKMRSLEALDLSRNDLSGNIPLSLSYLNYLGYLNLSYNHLSGRIPSGNQLQTLTDPSIYAGNIDLCGPPLPTNCSSNKTNASSTTEYVEDDKERVWLYYSIGLGYIAGFWVVCGVLLFKKTWRYAYFQFSDNMYDRLYVAVSLTVAKLKRMTIA